MGREHSRGTTQVSYTRRLRLVTLFVLYNVKKTVCTTQYSEIYFATFTQTAQEGTSTDFCRVQFHQLLCTSLATSASLLSSVTAFLLIAVIICGIGEMSRFILYPCWV